MQMGWRNVERSFLSSSTCFKIVKSRCLKHIKPRTGKHPKATMCPQMTAGFGTTGGLCSVRPAGCALSAIRPTPPDDRPRTHRTVVVASVRDDPASRSHSYLPRRRRCPPRKLRSPAHCPCPCRSRSYTGRTEHPPAVQSAWRLSLLAGRMRTCRTGEAN